MTRLNTAYNNNINTQFNLEEMQFTFLTQRCE